MERIRIIDEERFPSILLAVACPASLLADWGGVYAAPEGRGAAIPMEPLNHACGMETLNNVGG